MGEECSLEAPKLQKVVYIGDEHKRYESQYASPGCRVPQVMEFIAFLFDDVLRPSGRRVDHLTLMTQKTSIQLEDTSPLSRYARTTTVEHPLLEPVGYR